MACFLVPMGTAIGTSIAQKVTKNEEKKSELSWLNKMLWGGVASLAIEHALHGEIVAWPPFLTAMQNPQDVGPMLREMACVGIPMTVVIILVWRIMVVLVRKIGKIFAKEVVQNPPLG